MRRVGPAGALALGALHSEPKPLLVYLNFQGFQQLGESTFAKEFGIRRPNSGANRQIAMREKGKKRATHWTHTAFTAYGGAQSPEIAILNQYFDSRFVLLTLWCCPGVHERPTEITEAVSETVHRAVLH